MSRRQMSLRGWMSHFGGHSTSEVLRLRGKKPPRCARGAKRVVAARLCNLCPRNQGPGCGPGSAQPKTAAILSSRCQVKKVVGRIKNLLFFTKKSVL